MNFKPTIGLEIHVELQTNSKMFCQCLNDSNEFKVNSNICPVCLGHPGTLPVANKEAVRKAIKTALALSCSIEKQSFFERKNYFYPDLPKGYQISQYLAPLGRNGFLELVDGKKVRIRRVHLEEDTGRLVHPEGRNYSLVDFNRAGVPLMELVTEPDISSAAQAREFAKELQMILRYLAVSESNMEKGEMRIEVNISLSKNSLSGALGTKVEVKNLNSIRSVEKAIGFEIARQSQALKKGKKILQETRGWDDKKEITFSQRSKEEAHDYRYFPEPDLPPLNFSIQFLNEIRKEIPELPFQKRKRFREEYGLPQRDIELYLRQKDLGQYFEDVVSELREWVSAKKSNISQENLPKLTELANNYISTDLQALLKGGVFQPKDFPISAENFAEFLSMIERGEISSKIAKIILPEMFEKGQDPSQIIEEKSLKQITDVVEIEKIAGQVLKENSKAVEDYKNGKEASLQFLAGQVMAKTKGKANPGVLQQILKKLLS